MKNETLKEIIERITQESEKVKSETLLSTLLAEVLNLIMNAEREIHVEKTGDSKNGFYPRHLLAGTTPVEASIPRTRSSSFFPSIIPKYSRVLREQYQKLVENILISSKSIQSLKQTLSNLNLPYSPEEIEKIVETLYNEFKELNSRELQSDWLAIFIDAKVIDVKNEKGEVKKATFLTAVGVDMDGKKQFLASILVYGSENLDAWKEMLENLSQRGVRRVLIFVTDDFPGLDRVLKSFFSLSLHQLCIVHLIRRAKTRLKKEAFKNFKEFIEKMEKANSQEEAKQILLSALESIKHQHPYFVEEIKSKIDLYTNFTIFPKEIRSRLKSTNASENLHKELEKIRINSGGYFQSEKILFAKWAIFIKNLHSKKWLRPEPYFKSHLQTLHLLFQNIFQPPHIKNEKLTQNY
jgi:transposase-like protein